MSSLIIAVPYMLLLRSHPRTSPEDVVVLGKLFVVMCLVGSILSLVNWITSIAKKNKEFQMNRKVEALQRGETIISREPGNSMTPVLKSRQPVRLAPVRDDYIDNEKFLSSFVPGKGRHLIDSGDIVFCKVRGNYYTHLVKAYNPKRGFLIGNNHGHNNGWTWKIYGKVIEILSMDYKELK